MITADLRRRYKFFFEHDGYGIPPGRAACALYSAKVDALREELEADGRVRFEWRWDDDADWSWMDDEERQKDHDVEGCILYVGDEHEESLWGIFDADWNYRRIVEKGLLSEFIARNDSLRLPL